MPVHESDTQAGLDGLVELAMHLCGAGGGLMWLGEAGAARLIACKGISREAAAERVAAVAVAVTSGAEDAEVVGTSLRASDGLVIGGLAVLGPSTPSRPLLVGLAAQAVTLVALDGRLKEQRQVALAAQGVQTRLREVIANMPVVVFILDVAGNFTMSDGGALPRLGLKPGQVVGMSVFDVYRDAPKILDNMRRVLAGEPRAWIAELAGAVYETRTIVLRDKQGVQTGVLGVAIDVTERVEMEADHKRLQEEVIAVQAATLAELSTPLIPITRDTVVLPLIGAVDAARAERVLRTLLEGMAATRARVAILDVTGVARMDAQVADGLLRAARAVRLLGAEVVLTGIQPAVAKELIGLGVEFGSVVTRRTLESGIAWAMRRTSS